MLNQLFIILLISLCSSCGDHQGRRCLTKDEARTKCEAVKIGEGLLLAQAQAQCAPYYQYEGCYE